MKDLIWDNTLSVQVDEIDEDHRRLVDLFNLLSHAVMDGDEPRYIDAVMDELLSCTVWHFKHEERLMLKYGYEDLKAHEAEHQSLIESAKELQQKVRREDYQVSGQDIRFLEHWLTGHILGADMDMGAHLGRVM